MTGTRNITLTAPADGMIYLDVHPYSRFDSLNVIISGQNIYHRQDDGCFSVKFQVRKGDVFTISTTTRDSVYGNYPQYGVSLIPLR